MALRYSAAITARVPAARAEDHPVAFNPLWPAPG